MNTKQHSNEATNPQSNGDSSGQHSKRSVAVISIGQPFPDPQFQFTPDGACLSIDGGLSLLVKLSHPTKNEVRSFKRMKAYGLYRDETLPHGLVLWHFGGTFIQESLFDPRLEETIRKESVSWFLDRQANMCLRYLVDHNGIVRALAMLGMDWDFVNLLISVWTNPALDWGQYQQRYWDLAQRRTPQQLWASASDKFSVRKCIDLEDAA